NVKNALRLIPDIAKPRWVRFFWQKTFTRLDLQCPLLFNHCNFFGEEPNIYSGDDMTLFQVG
ncbi:MAG TPA: hypothetical protein VFG29_12370, partial [Syntrophales bacterium]|nr:hypothetical protein [Syntrophales bacterium]